MTATASQNQSASSGVPYPTGAILPDTQSHLRKLSQAWRHIKSRDAAGSPLHNASGLERGLRFPEQLSDWVLDDEWSGALYTDELRYLGLQHLGGNPKHHDIVVTNRLTAALYAAMQVTVRPGSKVIAVSPSYSHPAVVRAVRDAGGTLVETVGAEQFVDAIGSHTDVSVVVLTRLAVTYDCLPVEDLHQIVEAAHTHGARVVVDDAGGARVGPAILGQPRTLELGADLGATGLDKYGVSGPRVGLLGGDADLVSAARARAFELGSEARPVLYSAIANCLRSYRPARVRELVESTRNLGNVLAEQLGDWVEDTGFITRLPGEAILAELSRRSGQRLELAPIEATAALSMMLLAEHGLLTVHFAGLPPGTDALLIKFLPPETIAAIGGPQAFATAVDTSLDNVAKIATDSQAISEFILGTSS